MASIYNPLPTKRSSKYGCNYWETYSPKLKRNIRLFSDLEYDHWVLVETDPNVKCYCEQPLEFRCLFNGEVVKSVPDMWIQYNNGEEHFIEVKYSCDLDPECRKYEKTAKQIKVQKSWCESRGFKHYVKTEVEIRGNNILLSNMKLLLPYIKNRLQPIEIDKKNVINYLRKSNGISTIKHIENNLNNFPAIRIRESLSWLLYQGIISGNLDKISYSNETEVWLNDCKKTN